MINPEQLNIDAPFFFSLVTVFADEANEDYTFRAFASYLDEATERATYYLRPATDVAPDSVARVEKLAKTYICFEAARKAVPHLDLIYTPNGFGVVSNQNVAPASRERVKALTDALDERRDSALCYLLEELRDCSPSWGASIVAEQVYDSLIPLPIIAQSAGITLDETKQPPRTFAELARLGGAIALAQATLSDLVSEELVAHLLHHQRLPRAEREASRPYEVLLNRARAFIAGYLYDSTPKKVKRLADSIIRYAEDNGVREYLASSLYQARRGGAYENKREDSVFFFN